MIVIALVLIGAIMGFRAAKKRNGTGADIALYTTVYAIAFGLLGVLATIMIDRSLD